MDPEHKNSSDAIPAEESASLTNNSNGVNDRQTKHKSKLKVVLVIACFIVIAIPLIGYLWFVIALSGGIDGVINDLKSAPNPDSTKVVTQRNSVSDSINNSFAQLDSETGFTKYAMSTHDRCYEGQNNWKVKDGYAHRCSYRVTQYYGFNGNFRPQIIDFEKQILSYGWKPAYGSGYPMKRIMEEYYDKYYGPNKLLPRNFPERYLVSNLPTPIGGYSNDKKLLDVDFAEKTTNDLFSIEYAQSVRRDTGPETYDKKDFQDINNLFQKITQENKYVLVISIQEDYFQN